MKSHPHVVVVGAGIIGACAAYYLTQAGARVTVLESEVPAAGASGASDGAVSVASKRPGPMMHLARQSRALYVQLAREGVLHDIYHQRPTLLFARSPEELDLLDSQRGDLALEGEHTTVLSQMALRQHVPALGPQVRGGLEVGGDGHALGYRVVQRMLACAGVEPQRHTPVLEMLVEGGRVAGVLTPQGPVAADAVLVAAGLGSSDLLGLDAGDVLVPRQGQLVVTDRATSSGAALPGPLMSASYLGAKRQVLLGLSSVNLVIDPLQSGQFLIGGSREVGRRDRQTDIGTVSTILREAIEVYPPLARQRVIRTFAGVRIGTCDGLPIVGRHPSIEGCLIATGFEGDGICLAPLVGAAVARLAFGLVPDVDLAAVDPARFSGTPQRSAA